MNKATTILYASGLITCVITFLLAFSVRIQKKAKLSAASLKESELKFRTVVNSSSDSIVIVNEKGKIVYANQAALNLTGYTEQEIFQLQVEQLIPQKLRAVHQGYRQHYMQNPVKRDMSVVKSIVLLTKKGQEIPVEIGLNPIEFNHELAILCSIHDITRLKLIENKLKKQAESLQLVSDMDMAIRGSENFETALQHCINIICSNMNWPVGHVYWLDSSNKEQLIPSTIWYMENPEKVKHFYQLTMKTILMYGQGLPGRIFATHHPFWVEDVMVEKNFPRAPACVKDNLHCAAGFPVAIKDKIIAICEFFSYEIKKLDNDLLLIFILIGNEIGRLLEREQIQKSLLNAEERFRTAFDFAVLGMGMASPDGQFIKVNSAFCHLLGYSEEQMLKLKIQDITYAEDRETDYKNKQELLEGKKSSYQMEKRYVDKNGKPIWCLVSVSLIRDKVTNQPLYFVGQIQDIRKKREEEALLSSRATHDTLTGLANRFLLEKNVNQEIDATVKSNKLLGIFLLDIDYFKKINDNYGHDVGDELLKKVASRLQDTFVKPDHVARLGGDEFVLLVTDIPDMKSIATLAEKIMKIFHSPFLLKKEKISITISIGISVCPDNGSDYHLLLKKADIALYAAKNKGRNNFQFYSEK